MNLALESFKEEPAYRSKIYDALKKAIIDMDLYSSPEPHWIDERQISEQLGVSRTPVREALAMLAQEGFVSSVPRKGTMVVRKTKREIIEAIQAWAALESMAACSSLYKQATPILLNCVISLFFSTRRTSRGNI